MRPIFYLSIVIMLAVVGVCCNEKKSANQKETIIEGKMTLLVDETLTPIIEDQIAIFESRYNAKIEIDPRSETEVAQSLAKDSGRVAILARSLTPAELSLFQKKKVIPKITKFAVDAIALITNKADNDTLIDPQSIIDFLTQKPEGRVKGLVFDNPNSSTARFLNELARINEFPKNNVYSFKTNADVIKYIAQNKGMIGVVGVNWLTEPSSEIQSFLRRINIMHVRNQNGNYYYPSQNDIAEGKYPLARDLFCVNCQGYSGLGMGFASFMAGETGQRIILKSGLVPAHTPSRRIQVRSTIEKKKNN